MSDDPNDLFVETTSIYALDRCIKCLNAMNLGQNCYCTVVLKKGARKEDGLSGGGFERGPAQ